MKRKAYLRKLTLPIMVLALISSCNKKEDVTLENADSIYTLKNSDIKPKLGPGAAGAQTKGDISNPINIGTLDCRTKGKGGYTEQKIGSFNYGVYTLRGGYERYPDTRTRVERFVSPINCDKNRHVKFTAFFIIKDLGDKRTNIAQVHCGRSKILYGIKKGQISRSAFFAVGAEKTSYDNTFKIVISESVKPYTTASRGERTSKLLRHVKKNVVYKLTVKTGFNSIERAVSEVIVEKADDRNDFKSRIITHSFTPEHLGLRYGAYETADKGDISAKIGFRNTKVRFIN